jgi:hypothetical protein
MALTARAAHVLQCPVQNEPKPRGGGNPQNWAQFGSQAATRLREAGIASNGTSAFGAVNTFPGLVHTARHIMEVVCSRSACANRKGAAPYAMSGNWDEVVTR